MSRFDSYKPPSPDSWGLERQLERLVRSHQDVGKPGNPPAWGAGERRFKSGHPDWTYCPVAQRWCGWPLPRRLQVRVLPGQLDTEGRANRYEGTRVEAGGGASRCRFERVLLRL